jgi:GH25 family lysozyme M1 (1,4-beta-N-acetylmuramidase)
VIRLRRSVSIAASVVIVVGLVASVAVRTAASAPAALAATAPVQGTDVSSANSASINWASVAGAERFVAVKATEGNYYTDPDYQADVTKAVAAGLFVMPYVFADPYAGDGSGTATAQYAWNQEISKVTAPAYKSSPLMLPVAVDLESDPYVATQKNSDQCYGLTVPAMVTWIKDFFASAMKSLIQVTMAGTVSP